MNASLQHENGSEESYGFIKINLDFYTEGDQEFKRELAASLKEDILELNQALKTSLAEKQGAVYQKACHKVKTTLFILGCDRLNSIAENIKDFILKNQYQSQELREVVVRFEELLEKLKEDLDEVIYVVNP